MMPPPNGILPASSRARARHPNAPATIERISAARSEYPTFLPHAAAIRNAMRTWLAVRNAVSEANSPNAQGSSPRFGIRLGSAVAAANTAFSLDTAWMMRSTTGLRNGANWRASSASPKVWADAYLLGFATWPRMLIGQFND